MKRVLVIDTSILCIWLKVPGKDSCGPDGDRWNYARVDAKIDQEINAKTLFVLPLATIIETGNHISQAPQFRRECAMNLAEVMLKSADQESPWAAFSDQSSLWEPKKLRELAQTWPDLAAQKLSLGDATIKDVAEYYAQTGYSVEILTSDFGLKAYEPIVPIEVPRRRKSR